MKTISWVNLKRVIKNIQNLNKKFLPNSFLTAVGGKVQHSVLVCCQEKSVYCMTWGNSV